MEEKTMTAKHGGETYVASYSLDKRLRRTEIFLTVTIALLVLLLVAVGIIMIVKWNVVLTIIEKLIG